jgi:putative FmdB family regulatory protein
VPIYEYRCSACGHQFEVAQKMSDDPLTECEVCGGQVSKVLFAPAIHFKGTGFHNTDYGTRKRPPASDDGGGGSGGDSGSSNGDGGAAKPKAKEPASSGSSGKTVGLDKV